MAPAFERQFNPPGWHEQYQTEAIRFANRVRGRLRSENADIYDIAASEQNRSWHEVSGVEAEDSHFTVIIPIYNEAKFLPSVLATLDATLLPANTNVQVILLTNGCTDAGESESIVKKYMANHGQIENISLLNKHKRVLAEDPQIHSSADVVTTRNGIRLVHVNTPTPGKSNALNIGTQMAIDENHQIAICLDANTFPEPFAVAKIFGEAYRQSLTESGAGVVSGVYRDYVSQPQRIGRFTPRELLPSSLGGANTLYANGALMAWNTRWIQEIGGFDTRLPDDMYVAMQAVNSRRDAVNLPDAVTYRYAPATLEDRRKMLVRYVQQNFYIMQLHPELAQLVESSAFFMQSPEKRTAALQQWAGNDPERLQLLPQIIASWDEICEEGEQRARSHKPDGLWEPIPGTK